MNNYHDIALKHISKHTKKLRRKHYCNIVCSFEIWFWYHGSLIQVFPQQDTPWIFPLLAFCNVFSHLNRKGYGVETKPIRFVELPIISPPRFSVERTMVLLRKLRALVMKLNQIIIQVEQCSLLIHVFKQYFYSFRVKRIQHLKRQNVALSFFHQFFEISKIKDIPIYLKTKQTFDMKFDQ